MNKRKESMVICKNVITEHINPWDFAMDIAVNYTEFAEGEDYSSCLAMQECDIVKL